MNALLLGIYLVVGLIIFSYIFIVVMHIGEFREYSRYLSVVLKIYVFTVVVIFFFGAYKIITSPKVVWKKTPTTIENRNQF